MGKQNNKESRISPGEAMNDLYNIGDDIKKVITDWALGLGRNLRKVKPVLSPEQFEQWVQAEVDMDGTTANDFIAFKDGDQPTERMMRYFEQIAAKEAARRGK